MHDTDGFDGFSVPEQEAFGLSRAAVMLDAARTNRDTSPSALTEALNHNLELWVAIRTFAMRPDNPLPADVKKNLVDLSKYVAQKTFASPDGLTEEIIDSLININLQISEGLLEGARVDGR